MGASCEKIMCPENWTSAVCGCPWLDRDTRGRAQKEAEAETQTNLSSSATSACTCDNSSFPDEGKKPASPRQPQLHKQRARVYDLKEYQNTCDMLAREDEERRLLLECVALQHDRELDLDAQRIESLFAAIEPLILKAAAHPEQQPFRAIESRVRACYDAHREDPLACSPLVKAYLSTVTATYDERLRNARAEASQQELKCRVP